MEWYQLRANLKSIARKRTKTTESWKHLTRGVRLYLKEPSNLQ